MIPCTPLLNAIGPAIAAHAGTIADAEDAVKIALITAPFTPSNTLVVGALTLASLAGLTAITGVVGAQNESFDALTGDVLVEIKQPAGGLRWEATADDGYPVTIYGIALLNNAADTLLGVEALPQNVEIGSKNKSYQHRLLAMRIPKSSIR